MRLFIYEFMCGSTCRGSWASGLRVEGWAMLSALLDDFSRLPGVQVCTLLDEECPAPPVDVSVRRVRPGEEEAAFRKVAAEVDFALVIAPEFDNLLLERSQWAQAGGCRLLGPEPAAVQLTGDKRALAAHLQGRGVATPPVFSCSAAVPPELTWPAICKPRHGAGSTATFLVGDPIELPGCIAQSQAEGCGDELLLQPFVPGLPASVAFLIGPRQRIALLPAEQHLSQDGRFHYLGGRIPLPDELCHRAVRLAERAVHAVPGLFGYVGVDLVLGNAADGSADYVIEINPRLTTSYIGLRAVAETNLAAALLQVSTGGTDVRVCWRAFDDFFCFRTATNK